MKKLDLNQKKLISAGAASTKSLFWEKAIGGSIVAEVIVNVIKIILEAVLPVHNQGTTTSYSRGSYNGNFYSSHAMMQISKYPSQSKLRFGMPWN